MIKSEELNKIAKEIETCGICKVGKSGKAVPGEGNADARVVFIGEAPGKTEAATGRPFVGRSGKYLRSLISSIGLSEDQIYITSPVKYLPNRPARHRSAKASAGGGTPTSQDILHGKTHLDKQLKIISPKIVVLLGRVAAEGVLGNPPSPKGFGRARKVEVMKEHGKVIKEKEETRYFLTLHPAAAVKFVKFRKTIEEDFTKLKVILETY